MATTNIQIYMITAEAIKKQPYKTMQQSIKRLIALVKVVYLKTLSHKYPYYLIVKYFTSVI